MEVCRIRTRQNIFPDISHPVPLWICSAISTPHQRMVRGLNDRNPTNQIIPLYTRGLRILMLRSVVSKRCVSISNVWLIRNYRIWTGSRRTSNLRRNTVVGLIVATYICTPYLSVWLAHTNNSGTFRLAHLRYRRTFSIGQCLGNLSDDSHLCSHGPAISFVFTGPYIDRCCIRS